MLREQIGKVMKYLVVSHVNPFLRMLGGEITPEWKATSIQSALTRIATKRIPVATVIDVGASDGRWTAVARQFLPARHWLLIEAQATHLQGLLKIKHRAENVEVVLAAAGNQIGKAWFDSSDAFGGAVLREGRVPERQTKGGLRVPMTTIDHEVGQRKLPGPYLLKLDVHGFELPILEGATTTLTDTSVIIVESYNFKLSPESLRFHEMVAHMEGRGFRVIDMCEPLYRPKDGTLWQFDLIFAREDRPEFQVVGF